MSTSLAPLIRVLRQHRAASVGAFSTSIGVTVVEVLLPLLTRDAVDVATGQAGAGESSAATTLFPSLSPLWAIVVCLVMATVARYALQFSRRFSAGILSIDVQHRLRVSMLDTVLKLGGPAQDSLHTGQAVSRSISDISTVQGLCAVLPLTVGNATKLVLTVSLAWLRRRSQVSAWSRRFRSSSGKWHACTQKARSCIGAGCKLLGSQRCFSQ